MFATRDRAEWLALLEKHDVPFVPERRLSELQDDPQVRQLDLFYDVAHAAGGTVRSVHRAIRIDGSRDIDFRAPPVLGEHTREVLGALGISNRDLDGLAREGIVKLTA